MKMQGVCKHGRNYYLKYGLDVRDCRYMSISVFSTISFTPLRIICIMIKREKKAGKEFSPC